MIAHPPAECADPSSCPQHSESWHAHQGCTCLWAGGAEPAHVSPDCPAPHHVATRHDGQPDGRTTAEWIADLIRAKQDAESERDELCAEVERLQAALDSLGIELTRSDCFAAAREDVMDEVERLRATVARVEALADNPSAWVGGHHDSDCSFGCFADHPRGVLLNDLRAALAGGVAADAPTSSVQRDSLETQIHEDGGFIDRMVDAEAENERLHSWAGLLSLLDEHWPEDIFPTIADDWRRDTGPRLVAAVRRAAAAEAKLARVEALADDAEVWHNDRVDARHIGENLRAALVGGVAADAPTSSDGGAT